MNRKHLITGTVLAALVLITLVIDSSLAGNTTRLQAAPALTGVIAQALGTSDAKSTLPVAGQDFTLSDVSYLDDGNWAGALVVPVKTSADRAVVLLHKINGQYQVIVGPGTTFPSDYVTSLPGDVANYLTAKGSLYEPVAN